MKDFIKKDDGLYYEYQYTQETIKKTVRTVYIQQTHPFNGHCVEKEIDDYKEKYDFKEIPSIIATDWYTASNKVIVSNLDDSGLLHRNYGHYICEYKDRFGLGGGNYREYYDCKKLQMSDLWHEEVVPTWNNQVLPNLPQMLMVGLFSIGVLGMGAIMYDMVIDRSPYELFQAWLNIEETDQVTDFVQKAGQYIGEQVQSFGNSGCDCWD